MIRVLVAEDELPLLRGISRMIERICPDFQVVKMAKTGREALDYLQENPVDVVFTDINMPVTDGLEVLQYVNEHLPDTASVVISGYQEFDYAQKALQYGAKNYLIKPVDKKELAALLQELQNAHREAATEQKRKLLEQMYFGNFSGLTAQTFQHKIYPLYFMVKAYSAQSMDEEVAKLNVWRHCRLQEAFRTLDPAVEGVYIYYGRNPNELLVLAETEEKPDADRLVKLMQKNSGVTMPIAAAVGEALRDFHNLREDIGQVRRMIIQNWVYGMSGAVEERTEQQAFSLTELTEEMLQYVIKNRQFKEFQRMLLELKEQMRAQQITQYQLQQVLEKILKYIWAYQTIFTNTNPDDISYDINEMIVRADNLDEIMQEFLLLCHEIMSRGDIEESNVLMFKLDGFIQSHYKEQINTKMLAEKFGLVPSYLSKLFQNYKGLTPNHYLQKIRIEKSRELLTRQPEMMTKDIAFMVGYTDPSYFSKVFKKSTGLYPSEYRLAVLKKRDDPAQRETG